MELIFEKTKGLTDKPTHYCPGCTHGVIHRLVGEVLEEMEILEDSVGVASVGCSVLSYEYFNCDMTQAAHGRAPAVATGLKRVLPKDRIVFTYQGDGDLASIGMAEIVHAAARGENITVIFVNNAIYGMTGGQMAPTSLVGQKTATSPFGRDVSLQGAPIRVSELLATLDGAAYIERVSTHDVPHIIKAKKAIRKAFETQKKGLGFSMVEVLSTCPTNWGLDPEESLNWVKEQMVPVYPLGIYKNIEGGK
ncbi:MULTISPECIES: thiamine pyrophosphate-dependent enzyme [Tepidibacillus]|uniref:2-oxoglutarate oxidoreductase n=1 Tax=Tepidibacillus decaturensis TaxID=1413211 RepID=A0A135L376_9BACI|nr:MULTISPECIES: thiamine pyrophosphate-dependent enzyme [Tepidibacillus]KXG43313.1 2-oxoglutarate oxidoreductase [Tepidibacillus decaturensis]GBF11062.1 2-oxoglutarate oxidoreductase subunit KorB [Tepidibacillus sp. HK-1]